MTQTEFEKIAADEGIKLQVYKTGLEIAHRNAAYDDAIKIRQLIDESVERIRKAMFALRGF
jgi:hypothetical protein